MLTQLGILENIENSLGNSFESEKDDQSKAVLMYNANDKTLKLFKSNENNLEVSIYPQDDNILVPSNTVDNFFNKIKEGNNASLYILKESNKDKGESQKLIGKSEIVKKLEEDWASESEEELTTRDINQKNCKKYNTEANTADNRQLNNEHASGSIKIMLPPRTSQTALKDDLSTEHSINKSNFALGKYLCNDDDELNEIRACTKKIDRQKKHNSRLIEISKRLDTTEGSTNFHELAEEITTDNSLSKDNLVFDKTFTADINEDTGLENSLFSDKFQDNSHIKHQELLNNVEGTKIQQVVETLYIADHVKEHIVVGKKVVTKITDSSSNSYTVLPPQGTKHNARMLIIYPSDENQDNKSINSSSQINTKLPGLENNLDINETSGKEYRICIKSVKIIPAPLKQQGIKTDFYTTTCKPIKRKVSENSNKNVKILKTQNNDQIWDELVKDRINIPKPTATNVNSNVVSKEHINQKHPEILQWKQQSIIATDSLRSEKKKHHIFSDQDEHSNQENILYQCATCSYKTKFIVSFKQHQAIHRLLDPVAQFKCRHCPFQTKTEEILQNHLKEHTDLRLNYSCFSCGFGAKSKTISNKRIKASVVWHCIQKHTSETGLDKNYCLVKNLEAGDEYLECLWCYLQSTDSSDFDPHIKEHKNMGEFTTKVSRQSKSAHDGEG